MNKQSNSSVRAWRRALITASAGTLITFANTSCTSSLFSNRGSLFNRVKERNSYIDDEVQTTRRDRYAAENTTMLSPAPEPSPAPAARRNDDFAPAPLTPNNDLELDPAATFNQRPPMSASSARPEQPLRLPTLDSDFPQQDPFPTPEMAPRTNNNGYVPLQPRLPGAESIQPPTE